MTYLKSHEDFIKQGARRARRENEIETKRQARRERRSPNQASQVFIVKKRKICQSLFDMSY